MRRGTLYTSRGVNFSTTSNHDDGQIEVTARARAVVADGVNYYYRYIA